MTSTELLSAGSMLVSGRAAEIKRLADQANTISAQLKVIHLLEADRQQDALLDCSSLVDDFARDLDQLAGARK